MATFSTNHEPYLKKDRMKSPTYPELVVCSICDGILWLPKACRNCETTYCSSCIKNWQLTTSQHIPCPDNCPGFMENKFSAAILHILSKLEITCRYELSGCTKTLSYQNLTAHEEECDYRQETCSGCQQEILKKKNFKDHYNECPLVLLQCSKCATFYQRQDKEKHTENICSQIQLHQAENSSKQSDIRNATPTRKEKTSNFNGDHQLIQNFLMEYDNSVTWQLTHEQNINRILRPKLEIFFTQLGCNSYTDRCTRINNLITEYKEVLTIWRTHYKNIFKGLKPLLQRAVVDIRNTYGIGNN